jgi:beta-glucanase (GH16 family)
MPVGNLPGWNQIYADDFAGTITTSSGTVTEPANIPIGGFPNANWTDYGVITDTSRLGWRDAPETVSQSGGLLDIYMHTDSQGRHVGACLLPAAAGVSHSHGQLYGRYTIRMRADSVAGYKFVFLLWPDSEIWPADGEIDFPEANLNATQSGGATHYQNGTSGNDQDWFVVPGYNYGQWHTYTIQWTASALDYYIDGNLVHATTTRIPDTPMHPVIQAETVTDGSGAPSSAASGHIQMDWFVAYAPAA